MGLGDSRMCIEFGGNVGIGTTTPGAQLDVQGSVLATAYTSTSDSRIKENQEQVPHADCKRIFDAVEVKTYNRTDLDQQRVGFIAQDLDAVCTDEFACIVGRLKPTKQDATPQPENDDELLTVDYARLITVIWGVCNDPSSRLSELEKTIAGQIKHQKHSHQPYYVLQLPPSPSVLASFAAGHEPKSKTQKSTHLNNNMYLFCWCWPLRLLLTN